MSQPERTEMVRFNCPKCDRQMQARAEYAGRSTRCPGCQLQLAIPSAEAVKAAKVAGASALTRTGGGKGGLWMALAAVAVVVAIGGALAAWKFWPRGGPAGGGGPGFVMEEVDDLELLPATAQAVGSLRLADAWQRPAMKKALADLPRPGPAGADLATELESTFGLTPAEVERVGIVVLDADRDDLGYGVVRTGQPMDRAKVLSRLRNAAERTHEGKSYHVGAAAGQARAAVCLASPRVAIVGPEAGVQRAMEMLGAPRKHGPLSGAIELIRSGKYHGVVGMAPASGGLKQWRQNAQFAVLADAKTVTGTLRLAEKSSLDVLVEMPEEAKAKALRSTVAKLLAGARLLLAFAKTNPEQAKGAETAGKLLDALKLSQNGTEVRLRAETDEETAAALLVLALSQARR